MRMPTVPCGARHLRRFAEFQSYLTDFVAGRYPFLWIVGRPGAGKTESLQAALGGQRVYYRKGGQITPAQFYIDCYTHRAAPIILDDAEHLLDAKLGAKLISSLGDTGVVKQLSYVTTGRVLGDVPQTFHTTSPLCIIANRATAHEDIQSRAVTLYFDPTNLEIHQAVATWFWDQEIHDWFGKHLYDLLPVDSRWYVIADRDKRAGRDWRQIMLSTHSEHKTCCIVQELETDTAYPTREDKARRFKELVGKDKGGSRANYFHLRRRLDQVQRLHLEIVSPIVLRHTRPPTPPSLAELDSMELPPPRRQDEATGPLDVPAREQFAQPIRGQAAPATASARMQLDDTVPWERPRDDDAAADNDDQGDE